MKSLFPGLAIVCGTALLIAGNTTGGIVFTCLGFLGAIMGAAIRHQQEQEAMTVMKELTEALKKNSTSESQIHEVTEAVGHLGTALGEFMAAMLAPTHNDWGSDGGSGGIKH